jgi:uncharacterized protein YegL
VTSVALFDDYELTSTRTLPVILLLDTSGSMREDDKIEVLNDSVTEMIDELTEVDNGNGFINLTIITFGMYEAETIVRNVPIGEVAFTSLKANGPTPLGDALRQARELIEDKDEIPSQAFLPTIALVSDGVPTDEWEPELDALLAGERGKKATRFALAIGADADRTVLAKFAGSEIHEAEEASRIKDFLKYVTTTVTQVTLSVFVPDEAPIKDNPTSILRLQSDDAF